VILADTSIWVAHFKGNPAARPLIDLLQADEIATHPWVIGELALGGLAAEDRALFAALPALPEVASSEVLHLVEAERLAGTGLGWVDCQLLAAALVGNAALWTRDRRLAEAARAVGVSAEPG